MGSISVALTNSDPPLEWTDVTAGLTIGNIGAIAWNADGSVLAVSDGSALWLSLDQGADWALQTAAPGAVSIAISDSTTGNTGPGVDLAGMPAPYPSITAAGVVTYGGTIIAAASTYGNQSADMLARQFYAESGISSVGGVTTLNPDAISPAQAKGIAQIMRGTLHDLAQILGPLNPFNPTDSINGGALHMQQLLQMFSNNLGVAIGAYNSGQGNMQKYLAGTINLKPETFNYVKKITGRTLQDWVNNGGGTPGFTMISAMFNGSVSFCTNTGATWIAQTPLPGIDFWSGVALDGAGHHAVAVSGVGETVGSLWTWRG